MSNQAAWQSSSNKNSLVKSGHHEMRSLGTERQEGRRPLDEERQPGTCRSVRHLLWEQDQAGSTPAYQTGSSQPAR